MTDIATTWSAAGSVGDWTLQPAGLAAGDDLATAVLISLFTDRQADDDDAVPDGSADRRGWWGDLGAELPIGSKLWLLARSKQTPQVLVRARQYAAEALQWLVDDGVVASIDVHAEFVRSGFLGIVATLTQADGRTLSLQYSWAWREVG